MSGANEKVSEVFGRIGYYNGIAFQIADDLLDITGQEKKTGKNA